MTPFFTDTTVEPRVGTQGQEAITAQSRHCPSIGRKKKISTSVKKCLTVAEMLLGSLAAPQNF